MYVCMYVLYVCMCASAYVCGPVGLSHGAILGTQTLAPGSRLEFWLNSTNSRRLACLVACLLACLLGCLLACFIGAGVGGAQLSPLPPSSAPALVCVFERKASSELRR